MAKKISAKKALIESPAKRPTRKRAKAPVASRPLDQDVQAPTLLSLDYPQALETITSAHYTLRFTAPLELSSVEVSVDDGAFEPARFSVGHWWFDWTGYLPGEHRLQARAISPTGAESLVDRLCLVLL